MLMFTGRHRAHLPIRHTRPGLMSVQEQMETVMWTNRSLRPWPCSPRCGRGGQVPTGGGVPMVQELHGMGLPALP